MSLIEVENVIRGRLGIDPAALGSSVLPRAIEQRMRALGETQSNAYMELLAKDPHELEALSTDLVVSETWFFRGGRPLCQTLAQIIAERAASRPPGFPVRALSLPCSTGEEPYSLAIALHECGVPPTAYHIDAADLSKTHLERARAGLFSAFAFREPGPDIRPTYFHQSGSHWVPLPHLRQSVYFHLGNVTDPNFLPNELPYDLILCRNLFIYLTADARRRAIATLDRLLAATGCLCVTPAEADRLPPGHFAPEGPIEYGLYRRVVSSTKEAGPVKPPLSSSKLRPLATSPSGSISSPATRQKTATDSPSVNTQFKDNPRSTDSAECGVEDGKIPGNIPLDQARTLANAGRLAEARTACEASIRSQAELPEAYSLLGVIHQAEGHVPEAMEAFRKALYLAPNHIEAITHMIVLLNARGDAPQAAALQNRLKRLSRAEGQS